MASIAAKIVAAPVATMVISIARKWLKEQTEKNLDEIVSPNNNDNEQKVENVTTFDEEAAAKNKAISQALTKQMDEIQEGINILRNKDFKSAQLYFKKALIWRNNKKKFEAHIKSANDKCIEARSTIVESYDKIQLYALSIAVGFIYYSDYGQNNIDGLKHIYDTLIEMNEDQKLRKDLSAALGSRFFWTKSEKRLLKSVVYFVVRANKFIVAIQQYIKSQLHILQIQQHSEDNDAKNEHKDNLNREQIMNFAPQNARSTLEIYLSGKWLPTYDNGYCFGNVGNNVCKYTVMHGDVFANLMSVEQDSVEEYYFHVDDFVVINVNKYKPQKISKYAKEALIYFFNDENYDIGDKSIFNQTIISQKYLIFADSLGGQEEWKGMERSRLSCYYDIIVAILEKVSAKNAICFNLK